MPMMTHPSSPHQPRASYWLQLANLAVSGMRLALEVIRAAR